MAGAAGLWSQIGIANETVVNTPVAVTVFTEATSEGLEARANFAQGLGLAAGTSLVPEASRRFLTSLDGGGPVTFDVPTKGLGKWMQAMMGSYSTTATQMGVTTAYQQIHNVGSADGKTFTLQKGIPDAAGTVNPLTFGGCKVTDWTLTSSPNAIANLQLTIDAMSVAQTGAGALGLQAASYAASNSLYTFTQLTVSTFTAYTTVSGLITPTSPVNLITRNLSLKGGQPKNQTQWQAGSTTKTEALVNNFQPITGQLDVRFGDGASSMAFFNDYVTNASVGLQFTFTGGTAGAPNNYTLQFTLPAVFFENGSTPKVGGPDVVTVSYPFTALKDSNNNSLQVQIISTDTTV